VPDPSQALPDAGLAAVNGTKIDRFVRKRIVLPACRSQRKVLNGSRSRPWSGTRCAPLVNNGTVGSWNRDQTRYVRINQNRSMSLLIHMEAGRSLWMPGIRQHMFVQVQL